MKCSYFSFLSFHLNSVMFIPLIPSDTMDITIHWYIIQDIVRFIYTLHLLDERVCWEDWKRYLSRVGSRWFYYTGKGVLYKCDGLYVLCLWFHFFDFGVIMNKCFRNSSIIITFTAIIYMKSIIIEEVRKTLTNNNT